MITTVIKVCLVEDDDEIRDLTRLVLEMQGTIKCEPCYMVRRKNLFLSLRSFVLILF